MEKVGLVLEGGGMRGLYTAGVLECFLQKQIYFEYIVAVSAGACNAASYISRQQGRNEVVNTRFAGDWRYMSFRNFLREKSLFGMDFIFDEIPNKLVPFDFDTFFNNPCTFRIGTTDCKSGKPVYFDKDELDAKMTVLRASSSLPLLAPIVRFKGYELLDGGVTEPIPVHQALRDGCSKLVVILTQNKGYLKPPEKSVPLMKFTYRKYPKLVEAVANRHKAYNETLVFLEELEKEGKAIIIRPTKPLEVDRYEKDPAKLKELFLEGLADAEKAEGQIRNYLD